MWFEIATSSINYQLLLKWLPVIFDFSKMEKIYVKFCNFYLAKIVQLSALCIFRDIFLPNSFLYIILCTKSCPIKQSKIISFSSFSCRILFHKYPNDILWKKALKPHILNWYFFQWNTIHLFVQQNPVNSYVSLCCWEHVSLIISYRNSTF